MIRELRGCQEAVHEWGRANRVKFDPSKEHVFILDSTRPYGKEFDNLGVIFDTKLNMYKAIHAIAAESGRRLKVLLRTRRLYSIAALFRLYKAHVLPYCDRITPSIFHACASTLLN